MNIRTDNLNWSAGDLLARPEHRPSRGPLAWWYLHTAPTPVPLGASLEERELVRRGRLTSSVLLIIIALVILLLFVAVALRGDVTLLASLAAALGINLAALWFNRRGKVIAAGIVALLTVELGSAIGITVIPGGLDVNVLPLFDLLIQGELVAVSLLPAYTVFAVALANIIFIWAMLTYAPYSAGFAQLFHTHRYAVMVTPVILELVVAVVTFLWMHSTTQAIKRADRAETIASLEQVVAQQNQYTLKEKQLLEDGIQQLIQIHSAVANGNLFVRAPLTAHKSLWPLVNSINILFSRVQRALKHEVDLQRVHSVAAAFFEALQQARGGPINWHPTGTYFDQMVQQYNIYHRGEQGYGNQLFRKNAFDIYPDTRSNYK